MQNSKCEKSKRDSLIRQPDGPKNPQLVQMVQWIADPIGYMETASQRYGDIFTTQVGWGVGPHVIVSNPQAIQQIFTSESKQFPLLVSRSATL